jgi:ABC-2 type transport system ATP-binding protein
MSEMALTADHLMVIGRGRLVADAPLADFTRDGSLEDAYLRLTADEAEYRTGRTARP